MSSSLEKQINRRKSFAIISHPDAGKTTITEKLLLFGNAIHMAGEVKARKAKKFATSDWMEIEKKRGISVTSSVMQFNYEGFALNLLDTPGHEDFSEDTYRVLTAVDSALMVIDSAKGIEAQTKKLFQVCRDRKIPIITVMNKMDREGRDPFELMDEVENVLGLKCSAKTWPIGQGRAFKGVYDLETRQARLFQPGVATKNITQDLLDLDDPKLLEKIGENLLSDLKEHLELIEGASHPYDENAFLNGELSPVFFVSAINNFGIQELLNSFIKIAPHPQNRPAKTREVNPHENKFSGVVFKIQANMDPKHRDRIAFIRICSGKFEPPQNLYHVRDDRNFKLNSAIQFLSQDRKQVETAYAGDIIGVHDRGNLMIGDTITEGEKIEFTGVPFFSPENFCRVILKDPLKNKQLQKGLTQLMEEGTSQVFYRKINSDTIVGVVGRLQFDVVQYRLEHEYGAKAIYEPMEAVNSAWYLCKDKDVKMKFESIYNPQIVYDIRDYPMILFKSDWEKDYIQREMPEVKFYFSLIAYEKEL
jgi:peptide chain release factor 3